jgi:hypothetical protein
MTPPISSIPSSPSPHDSTTLRDFIHNLRDTPIEDNRNGKKEICSSHFRAIHDAVIMLPVTTAGHQYHTLTGSFPDCILTLRFVLHDLAKWSLQQCQIWAYYLSLNETSLQWQCKWPHPIPQLTRDSMSWWGMVLCNPYYSWREQAGSHPRVCKDPIHDHSDCSSTALGITYCRRHETFYARCLAKLLLSSIMQCSYSWWW